MDEHVAAVIAVEITAGDVNAGVVVASPACELHIGIRQGPGADRTKDDGGLMYVARSFDINRPGSRPDGLKGGVIGGSIVEGSFSVGDSILIAPGRRIHEGNKTR